MGRALHRHLPRHNPGFPQRATAITSPNVSLPSPPPREVSIRGVTKDGRTFRPSDWAERLAGAMCSFRPEGTMGGVASFIGYSPFCVPRLINGVKCVIVSESLKGIEPMAWEFVMNFARDNNLEVAEGSLGPDTGAGPSAGS